MSRTLTTQETKLLTLKSWATWTKVEIDSTGAGVFVDVTNFLGQDWLRTVQYDQVIDQAVASARVELQREIGGVSLAPLVAGSRANAGAVCVDIARDIKISTAMLPHAMAPNSGDWHLVFRGTIEDIEAGGRDGRIVLSCLDDGGDVQGMFAETTRYYGSAVGIAVETEMQQILDDNLGVGVVTLYTPVSPLWNVKQFKVDPIQTLEAVRRLATQIGWDVRYKWRAGTAQFELTFWCPDRTLAVANRTLSADEYTDLPAFKVSRTSIRNKVKVVYGLELNGARSSYTSSNAASQTRYGLRFCQIAEDATSNIDTAAEAQLMADAVLADLKDPGIDAGVEVPYFYAAELADLWTFSANGVQFDTDRSAAIVGISAKLGGSRDRGTMRLQLRGAPATRSHGWLQMETRPGVAPTIKDVSPAAPVNLVATSQTGQLTLTYDQPSEIDWLHTELHISTSNGFTPGQTTLRAQGRQTTFVAHGVPATVYYVKLIAVDFAGNKSTASAQATVTPAQVGTLHIADAAVSTVKVAAGAIGPDRLAIKTAFGSLNPNASLQIYEDG